MDGFARGFDPGEGRSAHSSIPPPEHPHAILDRQTAWPPNVRPEWTSVGSHQLLYLVSGLVQVDVETARWFLPPRRAAWVRSNVVHRLTPTIDVEIRRIFLPPDFLPQPPEVDCCVFAPQSLTTELFEHAMRFPQGTSPTPLSRVSFGLIAGMTREWLEKSLPLRLPTPRSQELAIAMSYTLEHLGGSPTIEDASRAAGLSARSLARRFQDETDTTWRKYLHDARMIRAMELLSVRRARIEHVARGVGFESAAAFSRAFEAFTGEKPKDYRRRFSH